MAKYKKLLRPLLFALAGAAAGLAYHYLIGCSTGSCAIGASPLRSMLYVAVIGLLLSAVFESS